VRVLFATLLACAACATPPSAPAPQTGDAGWERVFEDLRFYGDMRLRGESSVRQGSDPDRHRARMRLRVGADYRLNDEAQVGVRVVTGSADDPNSPHVTFGDALDGLELSLDRAFLVYRPASSTNTELRAGKFNHPFYRNEVYGELVWDADVQPEGVIVRQTFPDAVFDEVTFTIGGYALLEQSKGADASLVVSELSARERLGEDWASRFALAYYAYSDATPDGATGLLDDNAGNATVDTDMDMVADGFLSDFAVLDANAGFTFEGLERPLTLAAEAVRNEDAVSAGDGWAAGAAWGSTQSPGDWKLYYQYQVIEQDAVFSPFAQDDFLFATNHKSHVVGIDYKLNEDMGLNIWGLASRPEDTTGLAPSEDGTRWRLRVDLNIKF